MPRVNLTFDGDPRGAVGAGRQVVRSLQEIKAASAQSAQQSIADAVKQREGLQGLISEYKAVAASAKAGSEEQIVAAGLARRAEGELAETLGLTTREVRAQGAAVRNAEKDLGRLSRGALAGSGVFRGLGRSVAFASTGFLGAFGLAAAARGAFGELEAGVKASAQTQASLKSTGAVAGITAKQIDELAQAEMRKSGVDDELIKQGENWLLTFRQVRDEQGKGNDIFRQATKAALDLATAEANAKGTSVDMATASNLVGKALNDPIRGMTALNRVGITFSNTQRKQIADFMKVGDIMSAQKIILSELNAEVGGSAETYGKTLPGSISRAREEIRNMSADLLHGLTPAITHGVDELQRWVDKEQKSGDLQRRFNTVVEDGATVLHDIDSVIRAVTPAFEALDTAAGGASNVIGGLVALKFASKLASWSGGLKGVIGTKGATKAGLAGANAEAGALSATLAGLPATVAIAIAIEVVMHRKGITGKIGDAIDKIFGVPSQADAAAANAALPKANLAHPQDAITGLRRQLAERVLKLELEGISDVEIKRELTKGYSGESGRDLTIIQAIFDAKSLRQAKPGSAGASKQSALVATAKKLGPGSGGVYVTGMRGQTVQFNGAAHIAFDCSGYLQAIYKQNGINIPPTSETQWNDPNAIPVPKGQEQPGDGVFFTGSPKYAPPGHVGIYIGNGQFIEYYQSGRPAKVANLADRSDYWGARRWVRVEQKKGAGAPGSSFTPHNPADVKTPIKKKKVSAASITQLPGSLRLEIAKAGSTSGLADDIAAATDAIAFLSDRLKKATKDGVKADLTEAINQFQASIKDARAKLAQTKKDAAGRLSDEATITGDFKTGRAAADTAFKLNLLPVAEETKLRGQISKFGALVRKAEKDGKISPAELAKIKTSWTAMATGISDATQAVADNIRKVAGDKWTGITNQISRSVAEAWQVTQRDFGRETDKGVKAIQDKASTDIAAIQSSADSDIQKMSRAFSLTLRDFDRETQKGLDALEVATTPTEKLLADRLAQKTASDTTGRLTDLTKARDDAVAAEQAAQSAIGGASLSRGAESLQTYNARVQAASDALKQATQTRLDAQKALDAELYDEDTTALQARADAERAAQDEKTAADQQAYQDARDALKQSLQDQEDDREKARQATADSDAQARQTTADNDAQAYQDRRDAQSQALQDLHDDQVAALQTDLDQWGTWLANKQKTYASFLAWLAANPVSKGLAGVGPDPWGPPTSTTLPTSTNRLPARLVGRAVAFANGGTAPGRYVGVDDTVMARVTSGEEIVERDTAIALRRFLAGGGGGRGGPNFAGATFHVYGTTEREVAAALKRIIDGAPETISYRSGRPG